MSKRATRNIFLHILGWLVWLMIIFYMQPPAFSLNANVTTFVFKYLVYFASIIQIPIFYLNSNWLIPKFIHSKKYITYFSLLLLLLFVYVFVLCIFLIVWFQPNKNTFLQAFREGFPLPIIFPFAIDIIASTSYRYIIESAKKEKELDEKEKETLKSELFFLKSQVSPHFVFNVLNNMVSLARKKSDKLEPALIQLSSTLRYMLYDTNEDRVSLYKEIEYLKNYIQLQSLRYGDYIDIEFTVDIGTEDLLIEPMLLIPFVENAFKHGSDVYGDCFVKMFLKAENGCVYFDVSNKFNTNRNFKSLVNNSGIGLNNVKRRLELLYPNNHKLKIEPNENESIFYINLKINLR
jgi:sensor histidine kinase YesM